MKVEFDAYPVWEREGPPMAVETASDTIRKIMQEDAQEGPVAPVIPERAAPGRPEPRPAKVKTRRRLPRVPGLQLSWLVRPFRKGPQGGPAWARIGVLLIATALVLEPWLVGSLILLFLATPVIAYLTLGHDRSVEIVQDIHDRIEDRNPARAAALRRRTSKLSKRLSDLAERLPGGWADRLQMAGLAPEQPHEKMAGDPFDRL